jgi:cardiolipin synthase
MNRVQFLATGPKLLKAGVRAIEPVIEELIQQAECEIHIVAYMFTTQALHILDLLEKAAERGIKITIVINRLASQEEQVRARLEFLNHKFHYVRLVNFSDISGGQLHAKIVAVDRKRAVIGSANLSKGGMVTNYEIGVLIEGESVWKLAQLIDFFVNEFAASTYSD